MFVGPKKTSITIWKSSGRRRTIRAWIAKQTGDPLLMLRQMKFQAVGYRPIDGRPLNLVEQINQTWTYLVALAAAKQLLALHPEGAASG
jgi:hypothetical protein